MDAGKFSLAVLFFAIVMVGAVYGQAPDTLWTRTYWGSCAYSVQQTFDGGYILAGQGGSSQSYVIKTDCTGNQVWDLSHAYGELQIAYSVQQTSDGGYIAAGFGFSYITWVQFMLVMRISYAGELIWARHLYLPYAAVGYGVIEASDGHFIVVGGNGDLCIVKMDHNGDVIWYRSHGESGEEYGCSIEQTNDGGYLAVGGGQVQTSHTF